MYNDTTHHTQNSTISNLSPCAATAARVEAVGGTLAASCAQDGTPPYSNTGVTVPPSIDEGVADFLEFTLPVATLTDFDYYYRYFSNWFRGAERLDRGMHGYIRSARVLDSGLMLWHPERLEMGFHVSLPSTALAVFGRLDTRNTPYTIISKVFGMGGHLTRLDIACDTDEVTMEMVLAANDAGMLVTRARSVLEMKQHKGSQGSTLYVGSSKSDKMLRMYDKAAEQNVEGIIWTRCELQFRGKYADEVGHMLLTSDVSLASLIGGFVDFRKLDNSRINRRSQVDWWANWLGRFEKVRVTLSRIIKTMEETVQYVEKYLSSIVAVSWLRMGDQWLQRLIDQGLTRAKPVLMERFANS